MAVVRAAADRALINVLVAIAALPAWRTEAGKAVCTVRTRAPVAARVANAVVDLYSARRLRKPT